MLMKAMDLMAEARKADCCWTCEMEQKAKSKKVAKERCTKVELEMEPMEKQPTEPLRLEMKASMKMRMERKVIEAKMTMTEEKCKQQTFCADQTTTNH